MHRVWIVLGAAVGFAAGFVITTLAGFEATGSSECDGPCFSKWDEVVYVACGVGTVSALAVGLGVRLVLTRR